MNFLPIVRYYQKLAAGLLPWVYAVLFLFILAGFAGFFYYYRQPELMEAVARHFQDLLSSAPAGNKQLTVLIFRQNLTASVLAMFGGLILGLPTIFVVLTNGFLFGYVVHYLFATLSGSVAGKIAAISVSLLPHGIFELSIVLAAAAFGLKWGTGWTFPPARGWRGKYWVKTAGEILSFVPLLILVLMIAAVLEVFLSSRLADLLLISK